MVGVEKVSGAHTPFPPLPLSLLLQASPNAPSPPIPPSVLWRRLQGTVVTLTFTFNVVLGGTALVYATPTRVGKHRGLRC